MKLDKEQLALRRASITKGMRITSDCPITTPFITKSRAASSLDEVIVRMNKVRAAAEQVMTALRQQRH